MKLKTMRVLRLNGGKPFQIIVPNEIVVRNRCLGFILLVLSLLFMNSPLYPQSIFSPPMAKHIHSIDTINQKLGLDPFKWLENKEDTEVIDYLKAENTYCDSYFNNIKNTVDSIALVFKTYDENLNKCKNFAQRTGSFYYSKGSEPGEKHLTLWRTRDTVLNEREKVLDAGELAGNAVHFSLSNYLPSPDETQIAVIYELNGNRSILKIKDLLQNCYTDSLEDVESCSWASNSKSVVFTASDGTVIIHRIGKGIQDDRILYSEKDDSFMIDVGLSTSGKYIFITSYNNETSEVRYIPADLSEGKPILIQKRISHLRYIADHFSEDNFYLLTNLNTDNDKIVKTKISKPGIKNWSEIISPGSNTVINSFNLIMSQFLILEEQYQSEPRIRILDCKSMKEHLITFPTSRNGLKILFADTVQCKLIIEVCSEINPGSIYEYDLRQQALKLIRDFHIPGYDKSKYALERLWIPADSGIMIPVTLLYKKQLNPTGPRPLFLLAYGSYGYVEPIEFMPKAILLLDMGFYVAFASLRGGGELGEQWWKGGKLLNKINTFKDYLGCAEYFIDNGYTSKGLIAGSGGSAGGLIMGYIANERPDLFRGLIFNRAEVDPLTSNLNTSTDRSQFNEWLELGNPNKKKYYDYIASYALYNNVKYQKYPAMFFTTGFLDNNVEYWEGAKMVALLRSKKTDSNILLLRTQMEGTHFSANTKESDLQVSAEKFAFILKIFGLIK